MYPYLFAAALLPSSILAESLYGLLENTAPMSAWYSLIRPYVGELIDMKRSEPITILVPANDAVNEFTRSSAFQSMDDGGIRQLLMYHVLHGLHRYQDLVPDGPFFQSYLEIDGLSGGQRVQVGSTISSHSQDSDMVYFYSGMGQNASVWTHTYDSDGTYLLSIDSVLTIPLTVSETAIAAGLTSFAGAVTTVNTNLDTIQDATFFAPSNDAFEAVGSALNDASSSDLQDVLQYHYIDGTRAPLYTSEISTAQHATAQGNDVMLSYNGQDELFVNSAAVTYTNLLVQNGVLHIIDQVLNPNSNSTSQPAGSIGLPAFPDATRTDSPPFADAVSGAQVAAVSLGPDPNPTPLGPLAPGYGLQQKQMNIGSCWDAPMMVVAATALGISIFLL